MKIWFALAAAVSVSGCGAWQAPEVSTEKPGGGSVAVTEAIGGPCSGELSGEGATAVTAVPLRRHNKMDGDESDKWVYWKAGSLQMTENPGLEFIQSASWDMRVKRPIPMISANGGDTALNISRLDAQSAHGAFASWPESAQWFVAHGAQWFEDKFQGIEFGGMFLMPDHQNPLVNKAPPEHGQARAEGFWSDYKPLENHRIVFSGNVFVLRTTDGEGFYAIRFCEYSPAGNWLKFQWKRI